MYSIPHYVIKFVSNLQQVGGFLKGLVSTTSKSDRHNIINHHSPTPVTVGSSTMNTTRALGGKRRFYRHRDGCDCMVEKNHTYICRQHLYHLSSCEFDSRIWSDVLDMLWCYNIFSTISRIFVAFLRVPPPPLCCLVFIDIRILIAPLVSSNSSYTTTNKIDHHVVNDILWKLR